ncbi:MAG: PAS domain-containing protein [Paracoccaceae bacterium]|nr:PAS domain-containing protein [Paracoccaceae bacterium]
MDRIIDRGGSEPSGLVSLQERRLARRHTALVQVEAYWTSLRGSRLVPDRAEVDPRGLSGALEHAFVLERIAPGLARFRVAGMHLSDLIGLEVRGMPISATFAPDARAELARALDATFNEPARIRMSVTGETGIGRPVLQGEMVLLPLRSDGGEVSRALGCLVMDGKIGRQPRRLSITAMEHQTLTGYADGGTGTMPPPLPGAEPRRTPARDAALEKAPFLRLVHSRD